MADIKAFRAYLYGEAYRNELSSLVSPPYDVIHERQKKELQQLHCYNSVRLSLTESADDPQRYQKMRKIYEEWKEHKVLSQEREPGLYLIEDEYLWEGHKHKRLGLVALLQLAEFEEKIVFPHEYTLAGPKADRLSLLETMGAELSQILLCYQDASLCVEKIFDRLATSQKPDLQTSEPGDISRKLWIVRDPQEIAAIQSVFTSSPLLIADGHHRYETALDLRRKNPTPQNQFVQAYFTNAFNPGFTILPIHRMFHLPPSLSWEQFLKALSEKFSISPLGDTGSLEGLMSSRENELSFLMMTQLGASQARPSIYRVSRRKSQDLETVIEALHQDLFEGVLHWSPSEIKKGLVRFDHRESVLRESTAADKSLVGIYLPAPKYQDILDVVKSGKRMPQKSTFFYPKLATGLVIYELGNF